MIKSGCIFSVTDDRLRESSEGVKVYFVEDAKFVRAFLEEIVLPI